MRQTIRIAMLAALLVGGCLLLRRAKKVAEIVVNGDEIELRQRPKGAPDSAPRSPQLLVLALDGVSRDLLYEMLHEGKLPHFADLLGGDHFAHAYFDHSMLSTLPSTTMAAWATAFTGVTPAVHGVSSRKRRARTPRSRR